MKRLTTIFLLTSLISFSSISRAGHGRGGDGPFPLGFNTVRWLTEDLQYALTLTDCQGRLLQCKVQLFSLENNLLLAEGCIQKEISDGNYVLFLKDVDENFFTGLLNIKKSGQAHLVVNDKRQPSGIELKLSHP